MKNDVSLLIISSIGYKDCWQPLDFYLDKYLEKNLFDNIYISSNDCSSFDFKCDIQILRNDSKIWSNRLLSSVKKIKSKNVFVILEDYILNDFSNLKNLYSIFCKNNMDCLRVSSKKNLDKKKFFKISKFNKYSISLQPAFWNLEFLKKITKQNETPWEFELFGSVRNFFLNSNCFSLGLDYFDLNSMPFPCIFTGSIVKGKLISSELKRFKNDIKEFKTNRFLIKDTEIIKNVKIDKFEFIKLFFLKKLL